MSDTPDPGPGPVDRIADWSRWVGTKEVRYGILTNEMANALVTVLELPARSDQQPLHGSHWLAFDQFAPREATGVDGHPRRGGLLPPIDLPRRMWAGGRLEFLAPLPVDERLTRTSRVASVTGKTGMTGPLVFVTVEHEVWARSEPIIRERQDLVYMEVTTPRPRGSSSITEDKSPSSRRHTFIPDEVMLFRYSALTHNSHRIHYDADYAREVELYPRLVVHGPLTASLLLWLAGEAAGDRGVKRFNFRSRSPLYVGEPLVLATQATAGTMRLTAATDAGVIGMTAEAMPSTMDDLSD